MIETMLILSQAQRLYEFNFMVFSLLNIFVSLAEFYLKKSFFSFHQYYYSVRVFAGQEPSGVWAGWVTPDYHQYDPHFDLGKVRNVTVTVGDDKGNIHDR